jgi:serine beta-lactamase-like protein LACTB
MTSRRRRAEATLAVLVAAVVLVVGSAIVWFRLTKSVRTKPVHEAAAAVPSMAAAAPTDRYARPVEESRRLARALAVADNLPGLSVAVAVDGEIVWAEGFGWSDVESRAPLTPRTRFRLGALSKPLTAVAAALLHDRGRLDLDAPVQRYVPAYPGKPVSHCASLDEAVAMLADDPLLFEPGTQHRYSIWGWVLVSAVVQGAAGEPFARFMDRQVFEPLAMTRTLVSENEDLEVAHQGDRPDYSCVAGAGAFVSTPTDLVRLGSAMLKPGLLKAETIAAFQTPTRLVSGAPTTYALGWTVSSVPLAGVPARMVSHRGSPMGGTVSLLTFPDLGLAIAAAANVADANGVNPFARQVAEAFTKDATGSR